MNEYLPDMMNLAMKLGPLSHFYLGDADDGEGGALDALMLKGITHGGKSFGLYLTMEKEEVTDGT